MMWKTSYSLNEYGGLLKALCRTQKPKLIVELGTKDGYSAFHMAKGLFDYAVADPWGFEWTESVFEKPGKGKIHCYDLWEDYPYKNCSLDEAKMNLHQYLDNVELFKMDVLDAADRYEDGEIDILHIDLSNHGEILDEVFPLWADKVRDLVILEGGSEERDKVDWMTKYDKKPINEWLVKMQGEWNCIVLDAYPSITLMQRKQK